MPVASRDSAPCGNHTASNAVAQNVAVARASQRPAARHARAAPVSSHNTYSSTGRPRHESTTSQRDSWSPIGSQGSG